MQFPHGTPLTAILIHRRRGLPWGRGESACIFQLFKRFRFIRVARLGVPCLFIDMGGMKRARQNSTGNAALLLDFV